MTNIFTDAKTVMYNNKEVKSITTENGGVIWQKEEPMGYMTLTQAGSSFNYGKNIETNGDVIVDWGDGTTTTINNPGSNFSHTYTDEKSEHEIKFIGEINTLGNDCFSQCTGLKSIIIPSISNIWSYAFSDCTNLESVIISEGLKNLGRSVFYNCNKLTSVVLPNSLESMAMSCFGKCSSLTMISIPAKCTNTGGYLFEYCSALLDFQLYWEDTIVAYDRLDANINSIFTIPYGTTQLYVDAGYPSDKLRERSG